VVALVVGSVRCGRIAALNPAVTGAIFVGCSSSDQLSWRGKTRFWLGVDILWPDGETEAIKGFITEHDAVKWIAEHSKAWQVDTTQLASRRS
jgi:hypothetical protein